jgi:trypsin
MFSVTDLIIAICLIYHSVYGASDPQIVGGTDAPDGQYPYQVSLKDKFNRNHFCGGAIISKRCVITAAHCLNKKTPADVLIDVGSNYLSRNQTTYTANSLIIHQSYDPKKFVNDIGLIKLTKDIEFKKNIKPIALPSHDKNFTGVDLIVTGWGRLYWEGRIPENLQQIKVSGISLKECTRFFYDVSDQHICTFEGFGKGMCNGDSGGALTYNGDLVGIVSFGKIPCASGSPDVFTRVYQYKNWIKKYSCGGSNQQLNILFGFLTMYLCIHSFL